jgi:hypothetical protein
MSFITDDFRAIQAALPAHLLEVYSSVFIHYDNLLTCAYTPIHADTAAGIIVG